jgi:uncharacterized protein (TIGR03086 family)
VRGHYPTRRNGKRRRHEVTTIFGAMSEVSQRYSRVAEGFGTRVAGIEEAWAAPTPCAEWTVRDLVGHVVSVHRHVLSGFGGTLAPPAADDDLVTAWRDVTAGVRATLADPERAGAPVSGRFAPMPLEELIGRLLCIDTVVHTWDLARATGQNELLDRDAVTIAFEGIRPADEAIRGDGGYGPKIQPAPDADEQTRFLNFLGRAV